MLAYMEANHWGLWIEGLTPLGVAQVTTQATTMSTRQLADFKTPVRSAPNKYPEQLSHPVMINLAEITDRWTWGSGCAYSPAWYEANFGPIFNYMEMWHNGQKGDCFTTYWYEAGWPNFAQWLRGRTTMPIHWALSGWENYVGSTAGHDNIVYAGSWITGLLFKQAE